MAKFLGGWRRTMGGGLLGMSVCLMGGCALNLRPPTIMSSDPAANLLRQVASANLRVGLLTNEVDRALDDQGLSLMHVVDSGRNSTRCYGAAKSGEPSLHVVFRKDADSIYRVARWKVEAPSRSNS